MQLQLVWGDHDFIKLNITALYTKLLDFHQLVDYILDYACFKVEVEMLSQFDTVWPSGRTHLNASFHLYNCLETGIQLFRIAPGNHTVDTGVHRKFTGVSKIHMKPSSPGRNVPFQSVPCTQNLPTSPQLSQWLPQILDSLQAYQQWLHRVPYLKVSNCINHDSI